MDDYLHFLVTRLLNSGAEPYAHVCLLACRLRKWGNQVLLYEAGILNSCARHSPSDKRVVWITPLISLGNKHGKYLSFISFSQSRSRQQAALPGNYPQEPGESDKKRKQVIASNSNSIFLFAADIWGWL